MPEIPGRLALAAPARDVALQGSEQKACVEFGILQRDFPTLDCTLEFRGDLPLEDRRQLESVLVEAACVRGETSRSS